MACFRADYAAVTLKCVKNKILLMDDVAQSWVKLRIYLFKVWRECFSALIAVLGSFITVIDGTIVWDYIDSY